MAGAAHRFALPALRAAAWVAAGAAAGPGVGRAWAGRAVAQEGAAGDSDRALADQVPQR